MDQHFNIANHSWEIALRVLFIVKYPSITSFLLDHCASWKENMYVCTSVKRLGIRLLSQWSEKIFFCLGTILTSAGDSLSECTEIQSTDTSEEFNYAINIHWVLILSIKAFQGQIFHFTPVQNSSMYSGFLIGGVLLVFVSKLHWCSWIFLKQCTWTVWPLHAVI